MNRLSASAMEPNKILTSNTIHNNSYLVTILYNFYLEQDGWISQKMFNMQRFG